MSVESDEPFSKNACYREGEDFDDRSRGRGDKDNRQKQKRNRKRREKEKEEREKERERRGADGAYADAFAEEEIGIEEYLGQHPGFGGAIRAEREQRPQHVGDCNSSVSVSLVISNVSAAESDIEESVASLRQLGFVNYFGVRRFGKSGNGGLFQVGRELLRCQWQLAIERILQPCSTDSEVARAWKRRYMETGDARVCANRMRTGRERSLLYGIAQHGPGLQALLCLTRAQLQTFVGSYQSLVWNRLATERLRRHGARPVVGDLLQQPDGSVRLATDAAQLDGVDIADVVLPLPGHGAELPANGLGAVLHDLLAADGLRLGSFRHEVDELSADASYRRLVARPQQLRHSLRPGGLSLQFALAPSAYAAVAVRELTRDTAALYAHV